MKILYKTEDWVYDPDSYVLTYTNTGGSESLDPKSGKLLVFLIKSQDKVVSRRQIYNELFGFDSDRSDGTITAYVSKLRKLLETNLGVKGKYIKTISKSGYQFVGIVSAVSNVNASNDALGAVDKPEVTNLTTKKEKISTGNNHFFDKYWLKVASIAAFALILLSTFISNISIDSANQEWQVNQSGFVTNDAIAVSNDASTVALVEHSNDSVSLVLKSTQSQKSSQFHIVDNQKYQLTSPTFSLDGSLLAFVQKSAHACFIYEQLFDSQTLDLTAASKMLVELERCDVAPQLAYVDNNNILYLSQKSDSETFEIRVFNKSNELSAPALPTSKGSKVNQANDYWFAYNEQDQTMAFLRLENEDQTAVYHFDFVNNALQHIVSVEGKLNALDWLTNNSLIVMQNRHLKVIDIEQKELRPTSFAHVRHLLSENN